MGVYFEMKWLLGNRRIRAPCLDSIKGWCMTEPWCLVRYLEPGSYIMVNDVLHHFFAVHDSKISAQAAENHVIMQCSLNTPFLVGATGSCLAEESSMTEQNSVKVRGRGSRDGNIKSITTTA